MRTFAKTIFTIVVVVVLVFFIRTANIFPNEPDIVRVTDTLVIVKHDTIFCTTPVLVSKKDVDTIYVSVNADSVKKDTTNESYYVKLPREQLHYSEKGVYDAWVSGVQPRLDSFYIYQKETTRQVTHTLQAPKKFDYYATFSVNSYRQKPVVEVGIDAIKGNLLLGGQVGVIDNKFFVGVKVGLKLNGKRE